MSQDNPVKSRPRKFDAITRQDFLAQFVNQAGLTYEQAAKVYDAMVAMFSDGIVSAKKIGVGKLLSITPCRRPPRKVNSGLNGVKTTMYLGERFVFKVKIHRKFMSSHDLSWRL